MINIIKGGLRQQVTRDAYERMYKPNGWTIDSAGLPAEDETQKIVETMSEGNARNFLADKARAPRKFDDKIFKSEV